MTQDPRRPLHRLTPLRDDPAAAWLSAPQRVRVAMSGWFGWAMYFLFLQLVLWGQVVVMAQTMGFVPFRVPGIVTAMIGIGLIWPARRMVMRRRSAKTAELVRDSTPSLAVPIDDLGDLQAQQDGAVVSVVGWIRAGLQLTQPVNSEPCVGLAVACQQRYPGVLETLNDFELVDEANQTVPVQVAGARMLGAPNVNLSNASERMMVIASLDLPIGAVVTGWDAFVLRDGDPVMVVGFKQTTLDPTQASLRGPAARPSVGSLAPKPLLIFPIAAERRGQAPAMFKLS